MRQTRLPATAGARHCLPLRLDVARQRGRLVHGQAVHEVVPPIFHVPHPSVPADIDLGLVRGDIQVRHRDVLLPARPGVGRAAAGRQRTMSRGPGKIERHPPASICPRMARSSLTLRLDRTISPTSMAAIAR